MDSLFSWGTDPEAQGAIDGLSFLLGFVCALVLTALVFWLRHKRLKRTIMRPPAASTPPVILEGDVRAQVLLLRAEGRKAEAVRLVRSRLDCDVKAATDAVEGLR
jgi:hypothetical protein